MASNTQPEVEEGKGAGLRYCINGIAEKELQPARANVMNDFVIKFFIFPEMEGACI